MFIKKTIIILLTSLSIISCNSGNNITPDQTPAAQNLKIQNGLPVTDPEINGMVPLVLIGNNSLCTGTVIAADTILTAAHCVLDMAKKISGERYTKENMVSPQKVIIGFSKNLSEPINLGDPSPQLDLYSVKNIYVHEDAFLGATVLKNGSFKIYNLAAINDLAILKLNKPLDKRYPIAQLPEKPTKTGSKVLIVGYGVNEGSGVEVADSYAGDSGVLRSATSKIAQQDANYLFIGGRLDPVLGYTKICSGDSGGPDLIRGSNAGYQIIGVHSFGEGENCGTLRSAGGSVNVADYTNWIHSFM